MSSLTLLQNDEKIELWATLSLQYTPTLTLLLLKRILTYYSTATNALKVLSDDPFAWEHLGIKRTTIAFYLQQEWKEKATTVWNAIDALHNTTIIPYSSPQYPFLLKNIADPPAILYCSGDVSLLASPSVAIIGSRKASASGKQIAHSIASTVASFGLTVVSGLAEGIDTVAHKASLEYNATIAVLGNGINVVYPQKNTTLAKDISSKGCLLSEFPPNTPPKPHHFPIRNRIITGLSLGVLVVEATLKSGSLVTAKTALEQGKEVYVVPPQYTTSASLGTLQLLQNGAKTIIDGKDLFEDILPQISDSLLSPAVRAKLLEYHLRLSANQKDYYQDFLESLPENNRSLSKVDTVQKEENSTIPQQELTQLQESYFKEESSTHNTIKEHEDISPPVTLDTSNTHKNDATFQKNYSVLPIKHAPATEYSLHNNEKIVDQQAISTPPTIEEDVILRENSLQDELLRTTSFDIQYGLSELGETILSFLHTGNRTPEELFDLISTASIGSITTELIMLELQLLVQKNAGGIYGIFYK